MAERRVLHPRGGHLPPRAVIRTAGDDGELGLGDNPLDDLGGDEPLVSAFYTSTLPSPVEPPPPPTATTTTAVPTTTAAPTMAVPTTAVPTPTATTPPKQRASRSKGRQPLADGRTFRLVTFSFYEDDVARLDALLKVARQKGHRRASRSQIVRRAIQQIDLDTLPDDA